VRAVIVIANDLPGQCVLFVFQSSNLVSLTVHHIAIIGDFLGWVQ